MDFVSARTVDGRWFRTLTVIDIYTRECWRSVADRSLTGVKVAAALTPVRSVAAPTAIMVDNGGEFVSRAMDAWAYAHDVRLEFIRPGKPVENAFIESFNGRLRDECLNASLRLHGRSAARYSTPGVMTTITSAPTAACKIERLPRWAHCGSTHVSHVSRPQSLKSERTRDRRSLRDYFAVVFCGAGQSSLRDNCAVRRSTGRVNLNGGPHSMRGESEGAGHTTRGSSVVVEQPTQSRPTTENLIAGMPTAVGATLRRFTAGRLPRLRIRTFAPALRTDELFDPADDGIWPQRLHCRSRQYMLLLQHPMLDEESD